MIIENNTILDIPENTTVTISFQKGRGPVVQYNVGKHIGGTMDPLCENGLKQEFRKLVMDAAKECRKYG